MVIFGPLEFWYPKPKQPKTFETYALKSLFQWTQEDYLLEQKWKYEAWLRQNMTREEASRIRPDADETKEAIEDVGIVGIIGYENPFDDIRNKMKYDKKPRRAITKQLKIRLVTKRGGLCEDCREELFQQVHHIDGDPSNNDEDNLMLVCYDCHKEIEKLKPR